MTGPSDPASERGTVVCICDGFCSDSRLTDLAEDEPECQVCRSLDTQEFCPNEPRAGWI